MKDLKVVVDDYVVVLFIYKGKEVSIQIIFEMYNKYVYVSQKILGQIDFLCMDVVQKFYVSEGIVSKVMLVNEFFINQFVGVVK